MVLRNVFIATLAAIVLASSSPTIADEYRADEFLGLDLSRAVLSPKPLGPATGFTSGPLEVTVDRGRYGAQAAAQSTVEPKAVVHNARIVHQRAEQPRLVARTKLAHHQRNPLDAQAFDARIQTWPCKSGGICNWKR